MPTVKVLTRKPINPRGLTIVDQQGHTIPFPTSPSQWEYKDVQRWGQVEREGYKAVTRARGSGLRTLSFSFKVFALDTRTDVERQVVDFTNIAARGTVLRIKGGSPYYQGPCWWYVKDLGLKADRLTPAGKITQAEISMSLEEYVEPPSKVVKSPPPSKPPARPVKKPSPSAVKQPVYRYHTVVRGDWLSRLAIRYLGNMNEWPRIYSLNRAVIGPNPNIIRPGLRLKIPPK